MKRIYSVTASAALVAWSLAPANGAPKPKNESPSTEAQVILAHIDGQSATIADTAFMLGEMAKAARDTELHFQGLAVIREDVNRIGSELRSLEAERDSLSGWEREALDQIVPLMHTVARSAQNAILTFNSQRSRLLVTDYVDDTALVSKDADEVATLLRGYLKLANAQEEESRLDHSLGED